MRFIDELLHVSNRDVSLDARLSREISVAPVRLRLVFHSCRLVKF